MIVGQDYWNTGYAGLVLEYRPDTLEFRDLFEKYLKPGGHCFEVGCYPGNYLIYLAKTFGYTASGIDATPYVKNRMIKHFEEQQVTVGNIFYEDFLSFRTEQTYDVVCSFGFVEHFSNFEQVIERHVRLVKPSGTLIISCPNFRGLQHLFHKLVDPVNLSHHVLAAMDLRAWKAILEKNNMEIVFQGYYRTADFWVESPRTEYWAGVLEAYIKRLARKMDRKVKYPNRWVSPYMVSFSRKK